LHYSFKNINHHWKANEALFADLYHDWAEAYHLLFPLAGDVIHLLEGRKALAENCTHLLLSKGFNHTLATYSLILHGLLVDASLTARNGLETFLLLELFITDPTERYFQEWATGKEFKPAWVRQQLGTSPQVTVRNVVIDFQDDYDYYETVKMAYSFWSNITHANLKSAEHNTQSRSAFQITVLTGGNLNDQEALVNCLLTVLGKALHRCSVLTTAIFATDYLTTHQEQFTHIQHLMNSAMKSHSDRS
jgi:hypothetical protein